MIKITTGDKKEYELLVRQSDNSMSYEFNNTIYDFLNKEKSFVDRKNVRSRVLNIIGVFQGAENSQQSERFRISSLDKNYWILNHPIYGVIYGQPLKVSFSNSDLNTTIVEIEFWETIIDSKGITSTVSTSEKLDNLYIDLVQNGSNVFEGQDKRNLQSNLNVVRDNYQSLFYNNTSEFLDQYQNVSKSIDNVIRFPEQYIQDIFAFNNLVAKIKTDVFSKIARIENILNSILTDQNTTSKYKEIMGASVLGTMAQSIIEIDTNLVTRLQLVELNKTVVNSYNDYFLQLQGGQMDFELQSTLYSMIWIGVYNLFNVTYNARQQREYVCETDTNIILLTFKFMQTVTDENLRFMKKVNNVNTNELFNIKQGRIIKYYV